MREEVNNMNILEKIVLYIISYMLMLIAFFILVIALLSNSLGYTLFGIMIIFVLSYTQERIKES